MIFAWIIVIGVFLQVYFIAAYATGAGKSALDTHEFIGGLIVHASELIVFLSSLVAFWGLWKWVGWSFLLFAFGTVQIALVSAGDSGWVHGLHGLFALFVMLLAAYLAHRDMRLLGLKGGGDMAPAAGPLPQPPA